MYKVRRQLFVERVYKICNHTTIFPDHGYDHLHTLEAVSVVFSDFLFMLYKVYIHICVQCDPLYSFLESQNDWKWWVQNGQSYQTGLKVESVPMETHVWRPLFDPSCSMHKKATITSCNSVSKQVVMHSRKENWAHQYKYTKKKKKAQ